MSLKRTAAKFVAVAFIVTAVIFLLGLEFPEAVLWHEEYTKDVGFSPDSSKIVFIHADTWRIPSLADSTPVLKAKISAYWCDANSPETKKSLEVESVGREYGGYFSLPAGLVFSPDSKHIAIFTVRYLLVINLKSSQLRRLSHAGENVSSFRWLNNEEVGYVVHTRKKEGESYDERTFWRQRITDGPDSRKKIFPMSGVERGAFDSRPILFGEDLEHWSPKGRYVIFISSSRNSGRRFKLLDVVRGNIITSFGHPESYAALVSWKTDESEAFCVGGIGGEGRNQQAFLIQASTGEVSDCSKSFSSTFRTIVAPTLLPFWTDDGKYVLANDLLKLGPCLIQPHPWKIIELQKQLAKRVKLNAQYKPQLFRLPVSGWVGINTVASIGPVYSVPKYAVDYEVEECIQLFDVPGWWACSPDGRLAAVIGYAKGKKLTLHKLNIPEVKSSTSTH
ncbi:MAG: hypothetical protein ACYS83_03310 [Planctomycetota bacterium]